MQHSWNVCNTALMLREQMIQMKPELAEKLPVESVIMLLTLGLKLTRDEMLAIRWHMTAWELAFHSPEQKSNLQMARDTAPLCTIIQAADGLSSALLED